MIADPGESFHSDSIALPWAENWADDPCIQLKLLMVDVEGGRYAVRMRFQAGLQVAPHKHTGEVHAYTFSGRWTYLDYVDGPPNVAGSYLFEPPGTTHTLKVADDAGEWTEVLFILYGAMLHLDDTGAVIGVTDAQSVLTEYSRRLAEQQAPIPASLPVGGRMAYRALA
ncbi:2,4'-dihydroxyacetophenone dioxygenase family protein [Sphingobium nicotianae]|uniref:2,4'-dihydroxyacetophenone dioxygenase family protein n=1 Tax=Sphingobium nicotianae TaxID=2782607 RepID=A0A9X1DBG8_9SPHN|nr:2,4'-dihydroxyacetophenone dioxygenase family protein [Sphingobium nicotianae]MBT2186977.1 2,4'-dihydroxyacetophenone dioxygenase family protein [Sphingobium nicotianae]